MEEDVGIRVEEPLRCGDGKKGMPPPILVHVKRPLVINYSPSTNVDSQVRPSQPRRETLTHYNPTASIHPQQQKQLGAKD